MRQTLVLLAALFSLTLTARAQDPFSNFGAADPKVSGKAVLTPNPAEPGQVVTLTIELTIAGNYHVYGSANDLEMGLPIALEMVELGGLEKVGDPVIPPGEPHEAFGLTTHWLMSGTKLSQALKVPDDAEGGEFTVQARLVYSPCDDQACYDEEQVTVEAKGQIQAEDLEDISITTRIEPATARAGEVVTVTADVVVRNGWHAYGARDENPVTLDLEDFDWEAFDKAQVPSGELHEDPILGTNDWITGSFSVTRRYYVPADAEPGELLLPARFGYMLCDDKTCLAPTQDVVPVALTIEAGDARPAYLPTDVIESEDEGFGNLWQTLLAGLGAGLIALLMPCTYPMIPITISFFSKRAGSPGGTLGLSLAYGFGIVLMFNVIGVIVGPAIIPFANHWATNAVFAAAFIAFGLSLFGLFEIKLPSFLMNAAGQAQTTGGMLGVFLMGATLVITSFTCTAPIVGTLIAVSANDADGLMSIMVGMSGFGLALAIPFVVLSMFPSRTRSMPRAGEWMETLKHFLGFLEIAAALKFISNVDVALNVEPEKFLISFDNFFWTWAIVFSAAAAWAFKPVANKNLKFGNVRIGAGVLSLALIAWSAAAATGAYNDNIVSAFGPPKAEWAHTLIKDKSLAEFREEDSEKGDQMAQALYDDAITTATEDGKIVVINFTGLICANCRLVESGVMTQGEVKDLMEEHVVEMRFHVDYKPVQKRMQERTKSPENPQGAFFSPYYIAVDPKTGEELGRFRITNASTITEDFESFLRNAIAGASSAE